jgi:hypothetical protein
MIDDLSIDWNIGPSIHQITIASLGSLMNERVTGGHRRSMRKWSNATMMIQRIDDPM